MSEGTTVYVLTLGSSVLGVYQFHADAEHHRRFGIHATKQKDAAVRECMVRNRYEDGAR